MWVHKISASLFGIIVLLMSLLLALTALKERAAERALKERGVNVAATVTDGGTTQPKRGGLTYYLDLRYVVEGRTYEKLRETVPEEVYHRYVDETGVARLDGTFMIRYLQEEPGRIEFVQPKMDRGNIYASAWAWMFIAVGFLYGGYAVCKAK